MGQSLFRGLVRVLTGGAQDSPLPPQLVADLQKLVDDELRLRERKRRADRFQHAGVTAGAAVVISLVVVLLTAQDLNPKLTVIPASEDTRILLGTLAITSAIVVWNVLGWAGGRAAVPFGCCCGDWSLLPCSLL